MSSGVGAARRTHGPPVLVLAVGFAVPAELVVEDGEEPRVEEHGRPGPPACVEFRVGDHQHELGILDSRHAPQGRGSTGGGVVAYRAVDDVHASVERLLSLGATIHQEPIERGPGYITAWFSTRSATCSA